MTEYDEPTADEIAEAEDWAYDAEADHYESDAYWDYDTGYEDYEPNPYDGTYSEM